MTREREFIKEDKNGTKYFRVSESCWKCNGSGIYQWGAVHNGYCSYQGMCFSCHGTGVVHAIEKEYTPEHAAKLAKARAKRDEKQREEREAKIKEEEKKLAEQEARRIQREAEINAKKAKSEFVFEIGARAIFTARLEKKISFKVPSFRGYGETTKYIYIFKLGDNTIIYKTSSCLYSDDEGKLLEDGDEAEIKATIKAHEVYNDEKQTIIQRVKLLKVIKKEVKENA